MKTLLALTVLVLLCFLKHSSAKPVGIQMTITNPECCETMSNKIYIPKNKVTHVVMTSGCPREAIIVSTEKRRICLDPEWKHAQMHLQEFKKKSSASTLRP
ncbi:C-C motif chemokine 13-like [Archocentrus centrarchus]|uniref:C-C motif chemokine 13-like n=1 Tax=Archocentrus centrarchus TaxID=63155 RepID=UPI0011E9E639|nr:C-C motif chemokine 13-like [Archocentrus centrarchus]